MNIRDAQLEDAEAMHRVIQWAYRGGHPTSSSWTKEEGLIEGERITLEGLKKLIATTNEGIAQGKGDRLYVALDNDTNEVIGSVQVEVLGNECDIGQWTSLLFHHEKGSGGATLCTVWGC